MRPALLLLALLVIAFAPARSQAVPPNTILLACDTVSTSPLQVHFQFALQNPSNNPAPVFLTMYLCPGDPGTHIISCSSTAVGATCGPSQYCASGALWYMSQGLQPGQTVGPFDFVADQSPACFNAGFEDPLLGSRPRPDNTTFEKLCFSCAGVDVVPVQPSTWGKLKATYR